MSPSESDLRAALHRGEGDLPDPQLIIASAALVRAERRHRIRTAGAGLAAAVFIAGLGVGLHTLSGSQTASSAAGALVSRANRAPVAAPAGTTAASAAGAGGAVGGSRDRTSHETTHSTTGGRSVGGGVNNGSRPSGSPLPGTSTATAPNDPSGISPLSAARATRCPARPDRFLLPGGGGSGQFGSGAPLFARAIGALTVCEFGDSVVGPHNAVLSGPAAISVISALEAGSPSAPASSCPPVVPADVVVQPSFELFAFDVDGAALDPVTVEISCHARATNGTAVRYFSPSDAVAHLLLSLF